MPPQLSDCEGWPFRFLTHLPNKPDDFEDWANGCFEWLIGVPDYFFHSEGLDHE